MSFFFLHPERCDVRTTRKRRRAEYWLLKGLAESTGLSSQRDVILASLFFGGAEVCCRVGGRLRTLPRSLVGWARLTPSPRLPTLHSVHMAAAVIRIRPATTSSETRCWTWPLSGRWVPRDSVTLASWTSDSWQEHATWCCISIHLFAFQSFLV